MFCQVRLFLLLSPQPSKAQLQTCKCIFQLQMKKHRRLQQIMITRGGKKNKLNSSIMHKALYCTCSLKFSPSLFSTFLSVLQCKLTTVAVFLNLSLIVDCSIIFILLCLQSAAYLDSSFSLHLSVFFLFISYL